MLLFSSLLTLCLAGYAQGVTVYGQIPLGQTRSADNPQATTAAAYNDTLLTPPAVPSPAPATAFQIQVQRDAANTPGLSIPHNGGAFWGFSIEMSVISQVREYCLCSLRVRRGL